MDCRYDNGKHMFHVREEETTLSNLTKLLVVPVKHFIFINSISKKEYRFPKQMTVSRLNPPVEMSSRRVEAVPLIKRVWCSSFIPVNAGTVFRRLKRKLESTLPM